MICKDSKGGNIDVLEFESQQQQQLQQPIQGGHTMTTISAVNGYNTLQHRRKSQLITFSSSSCDIKNSLSHEYINGSNGSSANSNGAAGSGGSGSNRASRANVRLSFAEEDVMILPQSHQQSSNHQEDEVFTRRRSLLEVELGVEVGEDGELVTHELEEDLEEEEEDEEDEDEDEDEELYMHDEFETHIDTKSNNANDDSGGGSYEDSHALHSSLGGSNRNSLEKDDDDIEVDVISTDVSCYDQLLGSSCNTRNGDDDDIATLVGDGDYATTKLCKASRLTSGGLSGGLVVAGAGGGGAGNGGGGGGGGIGGIGGIGVNGGGVLGNGVGSEAGGGIIYANPFMGL
ncbi:hypothetical protein KR084_000932 [Drosophila pseudotakahashii]|nr:hypothetical protein KR084_000932 [Drosophila pseudotakahashii]